MVKELFERDLGELAAALDTAGGCVALDCSYSLQQPHQMSECSPLSVFVL